MLDDAEILHINPEGKYIIQFKVDTSHEDVIRAREILRQWWESEFPFLIIPNTVTLVRLDDRRTDQEAE
jgi:hypothetical protein